MGNFRGNISSDGEKSCHRGHWRPAEDEKLEQLVEQYGPKNWNFIAQHLPGRSGKSCRLRWYNQLDPNINKKPFTEEEEEMLLTAHKIQGNKWASISRLFPGRTDNAVKNHYHVIMARRKRDKLMLLNSKRSSSSSTLHHSNNKFHGFSKSDDSNKLGFCSSSRFHGVSLLSSSSSRSTITNEYCSYGERKNYQHFEFLNYKASVCNNGVKAVHHSLTFSSNNDQFSAAPWNLHEGSSKNKDIPLIDFLGVGIS